MLGHDIAAHQAPRPWPPTFGISSTSDWPHTTFTCALVSLLAGLYLLRIAASRDGPVLELSAASAGVHAASLKALHARCCYTDSKS
jgi:hypothetical protein